MTFVIYKKGGYAMRKRQNRWLALLLAGTMTAALLSGCSSQAGTTTAAQTEEAETAQAETTAAANEETEAAGVKYQAGAYTSTQTGYGRPV